MPILDKSEWPKEAIKYQDYIKGIFVGGCVTRGDGSRFRAKAHTHYPKSHNGGWICFLSAKRLNDPMLVLHEIAHLIEPNGHHDKWRETLIQIGGTLDPVPGLLRSYQKKTRS